MGSPMKIRARIEGDVVQVRVLMAHIMETGLRKNQQGEPIPAHYIQQVSATCKGKEVLTAQWGPAVSANPFIAFKFRGAAKGDRITFKWIDNRGDTRTDESIIQ